MFRLHLNSLTATVEMRYCEVGVQENGSHLYAYGGGAVYRSTDHGAGWQELVLLKSLLAVG